MFLCMESYIYILAVFGMIRGTDLSGLSELKYTLAEVKTIMRDTLNSHFSNPDAVLMFNMTITVKKCLLHFQCKRNCRTVSLQMHTKMHNK